MREAYIVACRLSSDTTTLSQCHPLNEFLDENSPTVAGLRLVVSVVASSIAMAGGRGESYMLILTSII